LEDCPVWELDDYKRIYETNDHKTLKKERDRFSSRQDFKNYMHDVYEDISCEILEEKMNAINTTSLVKEGKENL